MSSKRMDDADLSGLDIPERPYKSESFYGKGANQVDESSALAKILIIGQWEKFFIWFWRGELFDPYGSDILRKTQQESAKFKPISKDVFDNYMKYLKTKNRIYYTQARRLAMEAR